MKMFVISVGCVPDVHFITQGYNKEQAVDVAIRFAKKQKKDYSRFLDRKAMILSACELNTSSQAPAVVALIEVEMDTPQAVEPPPPNPAGMRRPV